MKQFSLGKNHRLCAKIAVDRVTARRRVREAYRLNRGALIPSEVAVPVDVAFVYISNSLESYSRIEKSVKRILTGIFGDCNKHTDESRS